jgi:hypothetical protein
MLHLVRTATPGSIAVRFHQISKYSFTTYVKGKGKDHPRTGHEGPEGG